jgi:hypothetical protein
MFTHHQEAYFLSSSELTTIIKQVFECPFEISGYFDCKTGLQPILSPVISFENAGMNFVVAKQEQRTIFFHTHPKVCYEHYGSFCGLPSASDLINMIQDYYNQVSIFSFIFAVEGIYTYQLSKHMMAFLMALKQSSVPEYIFELFKDQIHQEITKSGFLQTFCSIDIKQFNPFQTEITKYVENSLEHWKYFQPIITNLITFFETKLTIGNIFQLILQHLSEHHKNTLVNFIQTFNLSDQKIFQFQYTSYLEFSNKEIHSIIIDIV